MSRTIATTLALLTCTIVAYGLHEAHAHASPLDKYKPRTAEGKRYYKLGANFLLLKNYELAIKAFKDGFLVEDAPVFLYNLAVVHGEMGKLKESIDYYERFLLLARDPYPAVKGGVEKLVTKLRAELKKRERDKARDKKNKRHSTAKPPPPVKLPPGGRPVPELCFFTRPRRRPRAGAVLGHLRKTPLYATYASLSIKEAMKMKHTGLALLVFSAIACGEVRDDRVGPDAGDDSADGGTSQVTATLSPSDASVDVSVLVIPTLSFSASIDDSGASVTLTDLLFDRPVRFNVELDAQLNTLRIVPLKPLFGDRRYEVSVTGVRSESGDEVGAVSAVFRTFINPTVSIYNRQEATGTETMRRYDLTPTGETRRQVQLTSPGGDGAWLTADDVIGYYTDHPSQTRQAQIDDPGQDGIWFTADDLVTYYYEYDAIPMLSTRRWMYLEPGADGVWFTSDDPVASHTESERNARGDLTRTESYDINNKLVHVWVYTYDSNGNNVKQVSYRDAGPDGIWQTSDDEVEWHRSETFDANDRLLRYVYYNQPGPDGVWQTADDVPLFVSIYGYDERGLHTRSESYYGAGPDGVWQTSDDEMRFLGVTEFDSDGNETQSSSYSTGADKLPSTADDVLLSRRSYTVVSAQ